jgi:hypothetical protein
MLPLILLKENVFVTCHHTKFMEVNNGSSVTIVAPTISQHHYSYLKVSKVKYSNKNAGAILWVMTPHSPVDMSYTQVLYI